MNKNIRETELSYYGLYLLNYLKEHRFVEAKDMSFVKSRADRAAVKMYLQVVALVTVTHILPIKQHVLLLCASAMQMVIQGTCPIRAGCLSMVNLLRL